MDFRSLQSLALRVGEALAPDEVFARIVQGLAAQDGVALARVWLVRPGDICGACHQRESCPDQARCLHLVASAGASLDRTEDWSSLDGHFRRIPFGIGKVGGVAKHGPALYGPNLQDDPRVVRPEWARREGILSFAGQPLVRQGETLGVLGVFSRVPLSTEESDWLRIFADHAAIAIVNAEAFRDLQQVKQQLAQEVAELRRAEQELWLGEQRYRHIFQAAGVSIWEEDYSEVEAAIHGLRASGVTRFREYFASHPEFVRRTVSMVKLLDVNDAAVRLMGAGDRDELLVSLERVFLPETLPAFTEVIIALAEQRPGLQAESVLRTLKGDRIAVLFTVVFPTDRSPPGSALVSVMDITERNRLDEELRRSQDYLLTAQELIQVGSFASRIDSGESIWSVETKRIFGLDPSAPAPTYEESQKAWHPEDRARAAQIIENAGREKRGWELELRIVRPDGEIRFVHGKGEPVLDKAGEVVEWRGACLDVTERKRSERALRRAREQVLEARFAAQLAERTRLAREIHDTLLQGFTGVALRLVAVADRMTESPEMSAALRAVIGLAQSTLRDARSAVWDLRASSRSDGGLADLLRSAAEDELRGTTIQLTYGVEGSPRPLDEVAQATVVRIVQEAIRNVVKHAAASSASVRVAFGQRRLRVWVVDDGCGFAGPPQAFATGGHWGLLGMRERTAQLGGKLAVRSTPGGGTALQLTVSYAVKPGSSPVVR